VTDHIAILGYCTHKTRATVKLFSAIH